MPLAYAALQAAAIRPGDIVLEPSAGTGMLAVMAQCALGKHASGALHLNEIATILDHWLRGRRRALWLSASDKLLEDARRDWAAIGGSEADIIPLGKFRQGAEIPQEAGILFATYATLRSPARQGKRSRLEQIVGWLADGMDEDSRHAFGGVIVFDEAHAMANAAGSKGSRGDTAPSQQGRAGLRLQNALPDARILYVSATGATTVPGLAYARRLGLWGGADTGGETPFEQRTDFVTAMEAGGVAAMEVVARDLKALGLYQARALSYDGVEVEPLEHPLTPEQRRIYDAYAGAFKVIHRNIEDALKATGIMEGDATLNKNAKSAALSAFEGAKQRFFGHLLTAMKCPSLIRSDQAIQGLGRTHRTHQATAPLFRPVTTDVKGERRFIATIARRLDSLGAITRGQRDSQTAMGGGDATLFRASDNLESPYQPVDEVFPGRSRHGLILWCPGLKGGSLMAMGQQKDRQGDLMVSWSEMPRSPGHVFYDRLQLVLIEGGFDGFAEAVCQPYYAARMGAPSVPPGRYFRMHLVGYFEGIDSERGLEWRCSDSLSLREFLLLEMRERVPDHSWLSRTRARLPHEVHTAVFDWVLALIAEAGLVKGERIGVDASTMEANAALRNIVRRDTGEGYRGMLERLAQESGIETPTAEDLARLDRKRKGKKLSNQDWVSRSDPEAKIAKMKDGATHLAYKPEHAVDLDTGAVVAAELHPADEGDTTTLPKTLAAAEANLEAVDMAPTAEDPAECVTDKGYHSRLVLKALDDGPWKSRISEPKQKGFARWHGDDAARRAVTNNRTRLLSGVAREAFKLRAEIVERSFAHNLDRGGMRRTWLRGRENVHKRYLLHVAGHNLSLLMRQLIGAGTPKEAVAGGIGALFVLVTPAGAVLVVQIVLIVSEDGETAFAAICFAVA